VRALADSCVCSFFKTLVEHEITVELKNEVQIRGTLKSVDQYLNIKLDNAEAVDELRWPHLVRRHSSHWGGTAPGRMCAGTWLIDGGKHAARVYRPWEGKERWATAYAQE
jgi:small nuclear ribonucleoprotein (snRNP)-like protein